MNDFSGIKSPYEEVCVDESISYDRWAGQGRVASITLAESALA